MKLALLRAVSATTLRRFIWLLQISPRLVLRALRIVVGLNGLAVFVSRALALAGGIENLAQADMAPDFCPSRFSVTVQAVAVGVGRRLIVVLQKEDFCNSIVCQRAVLVNFQRFIEF